jgi:hypothetical protein
MRTLVLTLGLVALGCLGACDDEPDIITERDVSSDPLGDITALGDTIYATNDDRSDNAGSQVGLFRYLLDGSPAGDELTLELNGCGYLAMTDDDENLLLQVRESGRVISVSPGGELRWIRQDTELADGGWRACGICRRPGADEVVALYTRTDSTFVARTYNGDLSAVLATTDAFAWDGVPGRIYPRALVHDGTQWVVLAATADGANVTLTLDDAFNDLGPPVAEAASLTGLAVAGGWLHAAHDDGTVAPLRPVVTR